MAIAYYLFRVFVIRFRFLLSRIRVFLIFTAEILHELHAFISSRIAAFCLAHLSFEIRQASVALAFHPILQGFEHFTDLSLAVLIEGRSHLDGIRTGQQLLYEGNPVMNPG